MSKLDLTIGDVVDAIGPLDKWAHQCHGASLALVRSGLLPPGSRVARGWAKGVRGQHSWALVAPEMIYEPNNLVVDVTLWSNVPEAPLVYVHKASRWPHKPHGQGMLRQGSLVPTGSIITLEGLGSAGKLFLDMYAPDGLDYRGWHALVTGPMQGWPSKEIITAAAQDEKIRSIIPLDIVGMMTDLNPSNLYF